jgi:1,2-diacylglycerol 3-beta-galactosyltransferase
MKVLILFSDTGGGHRAASQAIKAALETEAAGVEVTLADGLVHGGPFPLNRAPAIYAWMMRSARWMWSLNFAISNGPTRAKWMADLGYPATARKLRRLIESHGPDIIVSTHPLLTRSVSRVRRRMKHPCPFAIVVTDLVTGHWSWYDDGADRIFLPTPEALEHVRTGGIDPQKLVMTGQAVHPRCRTAVDQRDALRHRFGWDGSLVVLMVGGGDGMGRLGDHARAVDAAALPIRIVVVCGRNAKLRSELTQHPWRTASEVHGFVDNLHELMAAADVLVSKSGPGSIMEGCVAGLPILLYDFLPGQEAGNVHLVESRGIGHYVPRSEDLVAALDRWIEDGDARARAAAAARAAAVPDSAARIARGVLDLLESSGPSR